MYVKPVLPDADTCTLPLFEHPVDIVGVAVMEMVLPAHGSAGAAGSGELLLQEFRQKNKEKEAANAVANFGTYFIQSKFRICTDMQQDRLPF